MASELFLFSYLLAVLIAGFSATQGATRQGRLSAWGAWVLFMVSMALAIYLLSDGVTVHWSIPFFSFGSSEQFVRVGLRVDPAAVAVGLLLGLLVGVVSLIEPLLFDSTQGAQSLEGVKKIVRNESPEPGAAVFAIAAGTFAWFSDGFWGLVLAQLMAGLSGWALLRTQPQAVTSFSRERAVGLVCSILGVSVFAAQGAHLSWSASQGFSAVSAPLGLVLLALGGFFQMSLFPALGWLPRSQAPASVSTPSLFLVSSASALSAFAVLYRLAPDFVGAPECEVLVFPALLFSVLGSWFSLSSSHTASQLIGASGAASGLSFALLILGGPALGATAFIGFQLLGWASCLILVSSGVNSGVNSGGGDHPGKDAGVLNRVIRVLLMMAWSGSGIFFSGAVLSGALASGAHPVEWVFLVLAWVMVTLAAHSLLAQRVGEAPRKSGSPGSHTPLHRNVMSAILVISLSSFIWNGALDGGFAKRSETAMGPALSLQLFHGLPDAGHTETLAVWGWTLLVILMIALKVPEKLSISRTFSWSIAGDGFRIREALAALLEWLYAAQRWAEQVLKGPRWTRISSAPVRGLVKLSGVASAWDYALREGVARLARSLAETPAKGLQVIQGGSLQTYLMFTVGFALALLLHFLSHLDY
jgi:hypothetical protein